MEKRFINAEHKAVIKIDSLTHLYCGQKKGKYIFTIIKLVNNEQIDKYTKPKTLWRVMKTYKGYTVIQASFFLPKLINHNIIENITAYTIYAQLAENL